MTDIAELGYKVDSSGLVEGTKALDDNAAAAEKAGAAAERLEKSQQGTGKSASYWAGEQQKINARVQEMERIEQRTAVATKQAATATEARELNLQKLLGQINPTVAALNRLAEQEDRLSKARDLGLIKPQVYQQYQAQLDATRTKVLSAAQGTDVLSGRLGQLNLRTVETQQSVMMLFRALATGDIGQAQASITSLTARTGALGGVMTATGLAVGAAVAGIAALSAIAITGYVELRKLEGQVAATGTAAGLTAGQLLTMRREIGGASGSYKEAGAAIEQLVQQGNASGQTLQLMASAAVNLADLTGSSISTTVGEVRSLAEGGADALVKLNDRYNFLTPEIYRHIEAIREQRGDYAATEAALEQLDGTMRDRASSMADSAGVVERAWKGALAAFADTVESIKSIGANDLDSQLQRARDDLQFFQSLSSSPIPGDASRGSAGADAARQRIVQLQQWKAELADGAAVLGQVHQYDRDVIAAERELAKEREVADQAVTARLAGLDRETAKRLAINKIIAEYNKLDDNDARHFDGSMQRLIAKAEADVNKQFNRSEGKAQPNKEAETLAKAYQSLNDQMAQQIALYGDASRVAATRYQIERGNLKGLRTDLAEVLIAQAAQLDAQNRQKAAMEGLNRLSAELNRSENQSLATARERLRILNEAKGEGVVSDDEYSSTLTRILSAGAEAPKVKGVDALYGGASGELSKLNKEQAELEVWYSQRIQTLDALRREESAINASYDAQALAARAEYNASMADIDDARRNVMLTAAEQGFGAVAEIMRRSTDEQSGIYRAAFAVSKAFSVAKAALAAKDAVSSALTSGLPFPANIAAMATAAAAVANLVSEVSAVGMAHDGIDSVPTEGTWLLNKGERVLTAGTAAKMDATLDRIATSGAAAPGAGGNVYAPTIQINGDPDARTLAMVEQSVRRGMQQNYDRISSELTTGQGRVGKGLRRGNNVSRRVT